MAFLLLAAGLIAWIWSEASLTQPYPRYRLDEARAVWPVPRQAPVAFSFALPEDPRPSGLGLIAKGAPGAGALVAVARDERSGRVVAQHRIESVGVARLDLTGVPPETERLRVELQSTAEPGGPVPWIGRAELPPELDTRAWEAGAPAASAPLWFLEYRLRSRWTLGLWLLVPFALVAALRRGGRGSSWLVLSSLAATATSVQLWLRFAAANSAARDFDAYGKSAEQIAAWISHPELRASIAEWFASYPQAHNALLPALLAGPVLLGVPMLPAYLLLDALCGFGALLSIRRLLERSGVAPRRAVAMTVLCACQLIVIRSFARPVTDVLGLLLVAWSLELVLARIERGGLRSTLGIAGLCLLHPLARPQGPALSAALALATIVLDLRRVGVVGLRACVRTWTLAFGVPAALLVALYSGFGWWHNARLMMEKSRLYAEYHTPLLGLTACLAVFQLLPLSWAPALRRLRDPRVAVLGAWLVLYGVLLVVVEAPLWPRHLVPVVPAVIGLTAVGTGALRGLAARLADSLLVGLAGLNVLAAVVQTELFYELLLAYQRQSMGEVLYSMLFE